MGVRLESLKDNTTIFHFGRQRLNDLFTEAVNYPLVVICAGAGYGKTSAVHDFVQTYQATTYWMQLSERDNVGARFWENYIHSMTHGNEALARTIAKLGFPDSKDKLNQYLALLRTNVEMKQRVIVMDDFHCITDPSVIRFVEEGIVLAMPPGTSVFIVTRSTPPVNIAGFAAREQIFNISENDLCFTDSELAQYFHQLDIPLRTESLREIMHDTEGWSFAINLIARSFQKAPGYEGYLRSAMKINIFRLMETEIWDGISLRLQSFLIRLSLIDHLSVDLIYLLANGDEQLIAEMEKQSAYIRRDSYINAYLIHPLFLEFLAQKQQFLTEEEKRQTYGIAGNWCNKNGFKIDALSYYEKIGDYQSIVASFFSLPVMIPSDLAKFASAIFDKAPPEAFDRVEYLVAMHLRSYFGQGLWDESFALAKAYEAKYLKPPEPSVQTEGQGSFPADEHFRNFTLSTIYYCLGFMRGRCCLTDDCFDFDIYFEKFANCARLVNEPPDVVKWGYHAPGAWINRAGSSRKGGPDDYINALSRALVHTSRCLDGFDTGEDVLSRGELRFYQGDIRAAQSFFARSLACAREVKYRRFEFIHRALFYTLRIAIVQGDAAKAEQALKEMKAHLNENDYPNRFTNYDITMSWYYYILGMPEKVSHWLKENFTPYGHASFYENFANQMKARYFYMTRNYPPLLSYIEEMKKRESVLYGRIEMLAIEACVHYKMKERESALAVLSEAFEAASPNNIVMPFIEMGKDMRTLVACAQKEPGYTIPKHLLEDIYRKSASYAKRRSHIITEYRQANNLNGSVYFSPREMETLIDLSHGLSRAEIAASHNRSINTVKMIINNMYSKLGAENLADLIRIATEQKMI